jgi:hypothetical protein
LWLTGNGGIYQTYHFIPVGDGNIFGQMGDNQLGMEYWDTPWTIERAFPPPFSVRATAT